MKFLILLLNNIRKMIKRYTLIWLVLLIGIIVTGAAFNIYYSYSAALGNTLTGVADAARVVDFNASQMNTAAYTAAGELLNKGSKEIKFYCVMSVVDVKADYIGISSIEPIITMSRGTWVSSGQVVVPNELGGKEYAPGDNFIINGKEFTVSGVYNPMHYRASLYNSHRLTRAEYAGAGVEEDFSENPEGFYDFTIRDTPGIFMAYEDYASLGLQSDMLRVRFSAAMGEGQKEDFAATLSEYVMDVCGIEITADPFSVANSEAIFTQEFFSKFTICVFIVLLSLVNAVTLFHYILQKNQRDNLLLKSLGATNRKIIALSCAELSIYILIGFTGGFFLARAITNLTDLKEISLHIGFSQYLLLLGVTLAVSLSVIAVSQRKLLKTIKPKAKRTGLAGNIKQKQLYLVLRNYTPALLRELVILLQVVLVAFSFTFSATYYFQRGANLRETRRYLGKDDIFIYSPNEYILEEQMKVSAGFIDESTSPVLDSLLDTLKGLDGLEKIGISTFYNFSFPQLPIEGTGETTTYFQTGYIMNAALIESYNPKMESGVWLDEWADGIDYDKSGYIPLVVNEPIAEEYGYKVGDTVEGQYIGLDFYYSVDKNFPLMCERWSENKPLSYNYKIVGIIAEESKLYSNQSYPVANNTILEKTVEEIPKEVQELLDIGPIRKVSTFYAPKIYRGGEEIFADDMYASWPLLFPDSKERITEWNMQIEGYGHIYDLEEVVKGMDYLFDEGTSEYTYHMYITAGLLIVGIAGYNLLSLERNRKTLGIYYSCGMPWRKASVISLLANGVIFFIGGVLGSVWGISSAVSSRDIMADTVIYSAVTAIAFVMGLFLISSIFMLLQMSKQNPINIIKKGGQ